MASPLAFTPREQRQNATIISNTCEQIGTPQQLKRLSDNLRGDMPKLEHSRHLDAYHPMKQLKPSLPIHVVVRLWIYTRSNYCVAINIFSSLITLLFFSDYPLPQTSEFTSQHSSNMCMAKCHEPPTPFFKFVLKKPYVLQDLE